VGGDDFILGLFEANGHGVHQFGEGWNAPDYTIIVFINNRLINILRCFCHGFRF
jgi:hypothetical protein